MKKVIYLLLVFVLLVPLWPDISAEANAIGNQNLSLSLEKVTPTRNELVLQSKNGQMIAESALNFEIMRNGMLLENPRKPLDVVFVFDKSGSMNEKINATDTRLKRAKAAMDTAITTFTAANTNRVNKDRFGLIIFESNVSVERFGGKYLTTDLQAIKKKVDSISANGGTNYSQSLSEALNIFKENKDPGREQIIIFLTDGEPTYLVTNEIPDGKYQTEETYMDRCRFLGFSYNCEKTRTVDVPYSQLEGGKIENYSQLFYIVYSDTNNNKYNYIGRMDSGDYNYNVRNGTVSSFRYNNNTLTFNSTANTYVENHAKQVAERIKAENIILYPVGFGEAKIDYLRTLSSKAANGESLARLATPQNLSTIFEQLVREIDTPSFQNVKIEVKLPRDVTITPSEGITLEKRNGINYAIVTPEAGRVQYNVGQAPGLVTIPTLPLAFNKEGTYNFEATLSYRDLNGVAKTRQYDKPITINVQSEASASFDFSMQYSTNANIGNNTIQLEKSNVVSNNKDQMDLIYTLKPTAKLANGVSGTLSNITVKQRIPKGFTLVNPASNISTQTLSDGSMEVSIPLQNITYSTSSGNVSFSPNQRSTSIRIKGEYSLSRQPIPDPRVEYNDSRKGNEVRIANIQQRFQENVQLIVKFIDANIQPVIEYEGDFSGEIRKYVKDNRTLLASSRIRNTGEEEIIAPIKRISLSTDEAYLRIEYADDNVEKLYVVPQVGVENSRGLLERKSNGEYETDHEAKVYFIQKIPGETTFEASFKVPSASTFTSWSPIQQDNYQYRVILPGTTRVRIKGEGGFIRLPFYRELAVNYHALNDFTLRYDNEMYIGDTQIIDTIVNTSGLLRDIPFNWSSSSEVLTVNNKGEVTANKPGEATITVTTPLSNIVRTATIRVLEEPLVTLNFHKSFYKTKVNQPLNLQGQLKIYPEFLRGNKKVEVIWESSNPSIYSIDDTGKGHGVSNGVVLVTATYKDDPTIVAKTVVQVGEADDSGNRTNNYRW